RERDKIRNEASGTVGLSGDASRRLGEIETELSGVDPSLLIAAEEEASLSGLAAIDKEGEEEKAKARQEAEDELLESRTKLTEKTKELNDAEADLKKASDDVVTALNTLTTSTDANFTAIETRTKSHVENMVAQ